MGVGDLTRNLDAGQAGNPTLSGSGTNWSSGTGVLGIASTAQSCGNPIASAVVNQGFEPLPAWGVAPSILTSELHWSADVTLGVAGPTTIDLWALSAVDAWPSVVASIPIPGGDVFSGGPTGPIVSTPLPVVPLSVVAFQLGVACTGYVIEVLTASMEYTVGIAVDPPSGPTAGGQAITIYGAGFTGVTTVDIDGNACTSVIVVDDFTITAVTPAGTGGLKTVTIDGIDFVDSYTYASANAAPTINPGPPQQVFGPPPATLTTAATVTPGTGGIASYAWTFEDGPTAPTIVSPSVANTDVTFDTYLPGTYRLRLTVVTDDTTPFTIFDFAYFIIPVTIAPRVQNGSRNVFWSDGTTLDPTITDDGWGGALSYSWTQLSGPDTATIVTPTVATTDLTFPEVAGVYLFQLTVTRDDALVGSGVWRVAVFTDVQDVEDLQTGPVTLLVNGVEDFAARLDTTRISKALGSTTTASFEFYDHDIARFSSIVIERGSRRLFGGICMSSQLKFDEDQPFRTINALGFAWHLHRKTFTKTYVNMSITDVILDIMTLQNLPITTDFVATGLPTISISFTDSYPDDAFTTMLNLIHGHWFVDDFAKLHAAVFESSGDPLTLSLRHPFVDQLTILKDSRPTINRVIVKFTTVSTATVDVDPEIEVPSLDNYSPTGGVTVIDGTTITYTGTAVRKNYLAVQIQLDRINETTVDGEIVSGGVILGTIVTAVGESWAMAGYTFSLTGGDNAVKVKLNTLLGDPATLALVKGINVYGNSSGDTEHFIGQIPYPQGGAVVYEKLAVDSDTLPIPSPSVDTSVETKFFLIGCTGTKQSDVPGRVQVDDTAAQAALAALIGGTDDGVIQIILETGIMSQADATVLAGAYLDASNTEKITINCTLRDDDAIPGQVLSLNYPDQPEDTITDLKIQSAELSGFELGVPHTYSITAARDVVTMDDLLKKSLKFIVN